MSHLLIFLVCNFSSLGHCKHCRNIWTISILWHTNKGALDRNIWCKPLWNGRDDKTISSSAPEVKRTDRQHFECFRKAWIGVSTVYCLKVCSRGLLRLFKVNYSVLLNNYKQYVNCLWLNCTLQYVMFPEEKIFQYLVLLSQSPSLILNCFCFIFSMVQNICRYDLNINFSFHYTCITPSTFILPIPFVFFNKTFRRSSIKT